MSDPDLAHIADNLLAATQNLKQHIALEGKKIGDALGVTYAKAAKEQIADAQADARRWKDCNTELRRQMKPLTRYAYAHIELEKRLRELVEDAKNRGVASVPAELLLVAMGDARTAAQAKWEREQADAQRQQELAGG